MGSDPGSARLHTTSLRVSHHYQELATFEAELFGLSTQPTEAVLYPVFPSSESAARVIAWLEQHPS